MKKAAGKEKKKMSIAKKLLILLGIILVIFGTINAVWYWGYMKSYHDISEKLDEVYIDGIEESDMLRYSRTIDGYTVTMKMPEYLSSSGFISVGKTGGYIGELDQEGNLIGGSGLYIELYIWPKYFGEFEMGLDFYDEAAGIWEQVEINADMTLRNTENMDESFVEYIEELILENYDEISKLIAVAEEALQSE